MKKFYNLAPDIDAYPVISKYLKEYKNYEGHKLSSMDG